MKTENLSTLKIHKLTQAQYEREREAGRLDEGALYLTPDSTSTGEGGGISEDAKNLLIEILRSCVYSSDKSSAITALANALSVSIEDLPETEPDEEPGLINGYNKLVHSWDFTKSLTDTTSGVTAQTNATQGENGIAFDAVNKYIRLKAGTISNNAIEIDIPSGAFTKHNNEHARIFGVSTDGNKTNSGAACFVWRINTAIGWASYFGIPTGTSGNAWGETISSVDYPMDFFNQKTLRLEFDSECYMTAYYADLGSSNFTKIHTWANPWTYSNGGFIIGSSDNNDLWPFTVSGVRIYEKEA
jgi:hypothetical protein